MKSSKGFIRRLLAPLFVWLMLGAAVMPTAEAAILLQPVLQGLASPVYVTSAHDGSRRLFVIEQGGRIKALASGALSPTVFLDITPKVLSGGEQGLLGLAFHPQFAVNSRFFVDYTRQPDGATVIAEYRASADPAVTAASETILLVIAQPFANHNGGMVEFGPDGYLYIGMGDGGSAFDPQKNAQNINRLLGKILRIDVDHPAGGLPYSSPPGNPFAGAKPGRDEIFALGFRNPYRFSFDRQTGQLYVGDVGQNVIEEVDLVTAGGNYGWRVFEGTQCTHVDKLPCDPTKFIAPITQYFHTGGRCSIIGGYVYRGVAGTLPAGTYLFGDFCSGEIFTLTGATQSVLLDTSLSISSFGEDEDGEIYVVDLGGSVSRLTATPTFATVTTLTSSLNPAPSGTIVTFIATTSGAAPTGSVSFPVDGGLSIAGCGAVALVGTGNIRTATCSTSGLAAGTHTIIGKYSGDAVNSASSSPPLSQVINAAAPIGTSFVGFDLATQGNWKGHYGADGYAILGDSASYPGYAAVTPSRTADLLWAAQPDTDPRALQRGTASGRIAAAWYGPTGSFNVDINLTDQATHRVAFYLLDWDTTNRVTQIDVLNAGNRRLLSTQTVSSYHQGVYAVWNLQGHVIVRFTSLNGLTPVLSGIFFDPAGTVVGVGEAGDTLARSAQNFALSTTASLSLDGSH